jgi:hypothetical protein
MSILPFRFFNFIVLAAIVAGIPACKKELPAQPPPSQSTITLTPEAASCTAAALKLSVNDAARPQSWELRRDGLKTTGGLLFASDTALLDLTLAPSRAYNYKAYRLENNKVVDSSAFVQVKTMDTTSSAYTFDIEYFGDGQSQFYDVFAVSDTEAYAVGHITKRDSLGRLNDDYNGARWDGKKWTLIKIPVLAFCDRTTTIPATLTNCLGISPNHFLFSEGSQIIRFDGSSYKDDCNKLPTFLVLKMWGSTNSQYLVGTKGITAYWDGKYYTLIPTSTTLDLTDIWGNDHEVWAVGGPPRNHTSTIQYMNDNTWINVDALTFIGQKHVNSVWVDEKGFSQKGFIGFTGNGVYYYDFGWKTPPDAMMKGYQSRTTNYWFDRIRGSNLNNVFAVGDYGIILHYNGSNWEFYPEVFTPSLPRLLYSVSVTKNKVFAVGDENSIGIIITGHKK